MLAHAHTHTKQTEGRERALTVPTTHLSRAQVATTKGTGGDLIILEEAAYCEPQFFYETVAPLMIVGRSCLLAISTLTSEINFYTRLMRIKDPSTGESVFKTFQVELVCKKCKEEGKGHDCSHMLHLVPRWQSSQKHEKIKLVMQDRPDLIQSELAGLAFDSLQQAFRPKDIDAMMSMQPLPARIQEPIFMFIDPAAGGPSSDYCILCITRYRGQVTVSSHPIPSHPTLGR